MIAQTFSLSIELLNKKMFSAFGAIILKPNPYTIAQVKDVSLIFSRGSTNKWGVVDTRPPPMGGTLNKKSLNGPLRKILGHGAAKEIPCPM